MYSTTLIEFWSATQGAVLECYTGQRDELSLPPTLLGHEVKNDTGAKWAYSTCIWSLEKAYAMCRVRYLCSFKATNRVGCQRIQAVSVCGPQRVYHVGQNTVAVFYVTTQLSYPDLSVFKTVTISDPSKSKRSIEGSIESVVWVSCSDFLMHTMAVL